MDNDCVETGTSKLQLLNYDIIRTITTASSVNMSITHVISSSTVWILCVNAWVKKNWGFFSRKFNTKNNTNITIRMYYRSAQRWKWKNTWPRLKMNQLYDLEPLLFVMELIMWLRLTVASCPSVLLWYRQWWRYSVRAYQQWPHDKRVLHCYCLWDAGQHRAPSHVLDN